MGFSLARLVMELAIHVKKLLNGQFLSDDNMEALVLGVREPITMLFDLGLPSVFEIFEQVEFVRDINREKLIDFLSEDVRSRLLTPSVDDTLYCDCGKCLGELRQYLAAETLVVLARYGIYVGSGSSAMKKINTIGRMTTKAIKKEILALLECDSELGENHSQNSNGDNDNEEELEEVERREDSMGVD